MQAHNNNTNCLTVKLSKAVPYMMSFANWCRVTDLWKSLTDRDRWTLFTWAISTSCLWHTKSQALHLNVVITSINWAIGSVASPSSMASAENTVNGDRYTHENNEMTQTVYYQRKSRSIALFTVKHQSSFLLTMFILSYQLLIWVNCYILQHTQRGYAVDRLSPVLDWRGRVLVTRTASITGLKRATA